MKFAQAASLAALVAVAATASPALAAGDAAKGLQDLRELNLTVIGNATGGHDVEGKTFIGGNLTNGATFGNGRSNQGFAPSARPTLTVGGNASGSINLNNGSNGPIAHGITPPGATIGGSAGTVNLNASDATLKVGGSVSTNGGNGATITVGGALVGNQHPTGTVMANQGAAYATGLTNDIAAERNALSADLGALSATLGGLTVIHPSTFSGDMNNFSFNAVDGGDGFALFNITGAFLSTFNNLILNLPTLSGGGRLTTIINVSGAGDYTINFNSNNSFANPYVIWNFIDAQNITFNRQFNGSVLALKATISNSTPLEGSIVANTFRQGGEVHLGTFAGNDNFLPPPPPVGGVPEPASWALMLVGFFGLGAMLRSARRRAAVVA